MRFPILMIVDVFFPLRNLEQFTRDADIIFNNCLLRVRKENVCM